jgi:primase-polymerase (primpol)-like protein
MSIIDKILKIPDIIIMVIKSGSGLHIIAKGEA